MTDRRWESIFAVVAIAALCLCVLLVPGCSDEAKGNVGSALIVLWIGAAIVSCAPAGRR